MKYLIDKGKTTAETSTSKLPAYTSQEIEGTKSDSFGSIMTKQALLSSSNNPPYLTTNEGSRSQTLELGTEYEILLQNDDKEKVVTSTSNVIQTNHQKASHVQTPVDKSHTTSTSSSTIPTSTASKVVTVSPLQRVNRHKQVMVTRTAQPIVTGSSNKSRKAKPLRLSHKLKEKVEEGLSTHQSPVKIPPGYPSPAIDSGVKGFIDKESSSKLPASKHVYSTKGTNVQVSRQSINYV